jgi:hypothetical protein
LFIAVMLAAVAFDFFAIAADAYGLPRIAALLAVAPHGCSSQSLLRCS